MNPREQGDVGERAAAAWLLTQGYPVAQPFGHDPDSDLWVRIDSIIHRVQVKTSTCFSRNRWVVSICTRGGNRSWSGIVKRLDASRCEYLFVLVGDGRQWFIPAVNSEAVQASCSGVRSTSASRSRRPDQSISSLGGFEPRSKLCRRSRWGTEAVKRTAL